MINRLKNRDRYKLVARDLRNILMALNNKDVAIQIEVAFFFDETLRLWQVRLKISSDASLMDALSRF